MAAGKENGKNRKAVKEVAEKSKEERGEIPRMQVIARIRNGFPEKFGVPRQSGIVNTTEAQIVFEPVYRNPDAVRGLEEFSHIWLLWVFSEAVREGWSPTVRPPRLGGNQRVGVFATRSPFRPNEIGLSSVRLTKIEYHKELGPVLHVTGADLIDGTPILDIKPYLPFVDSHPDAEGGFADRHKNDGLEVRFPEEWKKGMEEQTAETICALLAQDPRPGYQADQSRIYGMQYEGYEIRFQVEGKLLTVCEVRKI